VRYEHVASDPAEAEDKLHDTRREHKTQPENISGRSGAGYGHYQEHNIFGTPTGRIVHLNEELLPGAPLGVAPLRPILTGLSHTNGAGL
jgi:hypothetical protein